MSGDDPISSHNRLTLLMARQASEFDLATLIEWSRDRNDKVRDWATFYIGSQLSFDGADVRQALKDRLDDSDFDTRCEALVGLARRGDESAVRSLKKWLAGDNVSMMMIEAAGYYGRSDIVPLLEELRSWWDVDPELLEDAIAHCSGERRNEWWDTDRCAGNDNEG